MSTETAKTSTAGTEDLTRVRERAQAGDATACLTLARHYMGGGNPVRARRWFQRAADGGDADAAWELAQLHLRGGDLPPAPVEAVRWLERGARGGVASAMCQLAQFQLSGYGTRADLASARHWLLEAARRDCPSALRQLGLVYARIAPGVEWEPCAFECLWRAASLGDPLAMHACGVRLVEGRGTGTDRAAGMAWLGRARDAGMYMADKWLADEVPAVAEPTLLERPPELHEFDWPAPREATLVRQAKEPPVHRIDGLVDPEMCDYLINVAHPRLEPARTVDPKTGRPVRNRLRTNSHMGISGPLLDVPVHLVERDMVAVARADVSCAERLAMLRYGEGEEYRPHFDFISPHATDFQHEFRELGQRVKTIFAYLNDVPEGGETEFPRLDIKIKPRQGGGVMFRNVTPEGTPDNATLHAGCPVVEGEKWLATLWIREKSGTMR